MLKHTNIKVGNYYYIYYPEDGGWIITKTETKDDPYRWTGPCINNEDGNDSNMEFQDGSEDGHGGYFGGDSDCSDVKVEVRYATSEEIEWLDACIEAGELVEKPTQNLINMENTELTKDMAGKRFTCTIDDDEIKDGRIQFQGDSFYLCQNEKTGSDCDDKLGYEYSWSVSGGTKQDFKNNQVTNLVIIDEFSLDSPNPTVPQAIDEKKLVDGEIYTYQENYLFMQKAKSGREGRAYGSMWIKPSTRGHGNNADLSGGRFMTTTLEQKAHLNACIAAKKYVDPPKIELNQEQVDFLIQAMLAKVED